MGAKPRKRPPLRRRIANALRKEWRYSEQRTEALARARVDRADYRCEICQRSGLAPKEVQVDHIVPVGTMPGSSNDDGSTTWNGYIRRLFCDVSGLRVLCKPCHRGVTL